MSNTTLQAVFYRKKQLRNITVYTCDPDLEIGGYSAHSLLESETRNHYLDILEKHGLSNINKDIWYPVQNLLGVLNDINEQRSAMIDFISIGLAASDNSQLPLDVQHLSFRDFFLGYGSIYRRIYRNGDPGEIQVEEIEENHLAITLIDVPFPDDLMYGVLYGFACRFANNGEKFTFHYDDQRRRRDQGGEYTIIHLIWE
jgi:hypothetical protein